MFGQYNEKIEAKECDVTNIILKIQEVIYNFV
jgi:hypothetical protein